MKDGRHRVIGAKVGGNTFSLLLRFTDELM